MWWWETSVGFLRRNSQQLKNSLQYLNPHRENTNTGYLQHVSTHDGGFRPVSWATSREKFTKRNMNFSPKHSWNAGRWGDADRKAGHWGQWRQPDDSPGNSTEWDAYKTRQHLSLERESSSHSSRAERIHEAFVFRATVTHSQPFQFHSVQKS